LGSLRERRKKSKRRFYLMKKNTNKKTNIAILNGNRRTPALLDKTEIERLLETLEDTSTQTKLKLLWNGYIGTQSKLNADPSAKHIRDLRVAEDALRAFLDEIGEKPAPSVSPSRRRTSLKRPEDVRRFLSSLVNQLKWGTVDVASARAMIYGCQVLLGCMSDHLLEQRVSAMEVVLAEKNKREEV